MPHDFRQRVYVASAFNHHGGKGMPQRMRGEVESGFLPEPRYEAGKAFLGSLRIVLRSDEKVFASLSETFPLPQVTLYDAVEPGTNRDHPVFLALALDDADDRVIQIDVSHAETEGFVPPESSEYHARYNRHIPLFFKPVFVPERGQSLEDYLGLVLVEPSRKPLFQSRLLYELHEILLDHFLFEEPFAETAEMLVVGQVGVRKP